MLDQLTWIEEHKNSVPQQDAGSTIGRTYPQILAIYVEQLTNLPQIVAGYASVDTYARWLNTTKSWRKLDELRAVLTLFFTLEQFRRGFDPRYESFVGAILDHGNRCLPKELTVLTWNYDQHLALALSRSKQARNIRTVMQDFRIATLYAVGKGRAKDFQVLHLNGIAGVHSRMADHPLLDDIENPELNANKWMHWLHFFALGFMDRMSDGMVSLFNYSWDSLDDRDMNWNAVEERVSEVEKLMVVGYSFPDFNRSVDLRLIGAMKGLKQIVVQTTPASMEGLITKLHMLLPERAEMIVPYPITHEFFIPNELLVKQ